MNKLVLYATIVDTNGLEITNALDNYASITLGVAGQPGSGPVSAKLSFAGAYDMSQLLGTIFLRKP